MDTKHIVTLVVLAIAFAVTMAWSAWPDAVAQEPAIPIAQVIEAPTGPPPPTKTELELAHRRETWISALEYCESRGKNDALNPEDRDGTPSYSNFQWKPTTILGFAKKYGLTATTTTLAEVPELLKDYELQRETVRRMIDDPSVNFYQQFPDCVRLKVGLPPKR